MVIQSLQGVFSVSTAPENQEKLVVRSNDLDSLCRLFDRKRVKADCDQGYSFCVTICKEELSSVLIKLVKQIDYEDFDQIMSELVLEKASVFAKA